MILGWRETLVTVWWMFSHAWRNLFRCNLTCQRNIQKACSENEDMLRNDDFGPVEGYQQNWVDPIKYGGIGSAEGKGISRQRNVRWLLYYANQILNIINVVLSYLGIIYPKEHTKEGNCEECWYALRTTVAFRPIQATFHFRIPEFDGL